MPEPRPMPEPKPGEPKVGDFVSVSVIEHNAPVVYFPKAVIMPDRRFKPLAFSDRARQRGWSKPAVEKAWGKGVNFDRIWVMEPIAYQEPLDEIVERVLNCGEANMKEINRESWLEFFQSGYVREDTFDYESPTFDDTYLKDHYNESCASPDCIAYRKWIKESEFATGDPLDAIVGRVINYKGGRDV